MDLVIILSVLVCVLLIVQITVLMRMHTIIKALKRLLYEIKGRYDNPSKIKQQKTPKPSCRYCKNRQTFINAGAAHTISDDFYYRCKLHNREVRLNDYCENFEPEKLRHI